MSSILAGDPGAAAPVADPVADPSVVAPVADPGKPGVTPEPQAEFEKAGWIEQLLPKNKNNAELVKQLSEKYPKLDDMVTALSEVTPAAEKVGNATEYELPAVEYPEGMEADPRAEEFFRGLALEARLDKETAAQAWKKFNEWTVGQLNEAIDADKQLKVDAVSSLKRIWGHTFDKNVEIVRRHMKETATPELLTRIDDSGLGNDPDFVRWIHKQAQGFGEDTAVMGETPKKPEEDIVETFFPQEKSHITKGRKEF